MGNYQLALAPEDVSQVADWLALNRGALDVFVHQDTGDELRDHRDCALWSGKFRSLDGAALRA